MGFFSWRTSDTDRSIANSFSERETFQVHMVTRDGRAWTEDDYEGYGEFGGKDYYELVAELNGKTDRHEGINLDLGVRAVTNGDLIFRAQGVDFFNWDKEILHDGKNANQLAKTPGWKQITVFKEGRQSPKLVEHLPEKGQNWQEWFDALPKSPNCEYQGFFYD